MTYRETILCVLALFLCCAAYAAGRWTHPLDGLHGEIAPDCWVSHSPADGPDGIASTRGVTHREDGCMDGLTRWCQLWCEDELLGVTKEE